MGRKVSKKRTHSFPARIQARKKQLFTLKSWKNWMDWKNWKIVTYGVEWLAILSSLLWAVEARTSEIKSAIKIEPSKIEATRSLARIAPKQTIPVVPLPQTNQSKRNEVSTSQKRFNFMGNFQAIDQVSFGNSISKEFKQNPFYSPTTFVLVRF